MSKIDAIRFVDDWLIPSLNIKAKSRALSVGEGDDEHCSTVLDDSIELRLLVSSSSLLNTKM